MARRDSDEPAYYETQFQSLLLDKIKDVHSDLKDVRNELRENTKQTKITNGRVTKLESETSRIEADVHDINNWRQDFIVVSRKPAVLDNKKLAYMALVALIFFLVIIAAVIGVKLPGLL